jgi:hypothetical protein
MKLPLNLAVAVLASVCSHAQITTPVIKANFGVDGDLRSNFKDGADLVGNDDWFTQAGTAGAGQSVIDTNGAAGIRARYVSDMAFRRLPFFRNMRVAPFTVVNGKTWIDGVFIRDYHGDDSTVFAAGANKNGDSPANWSCPTAQSVPAKNDILDMMVHIRRDGTASTDSLWMFGGLSLDNTNGNRYIDFEMYQTDIFYDRSTLSFSGYGPDAGHTSWQFDAAGNVTQAGDIIFNAEYQSSSLTSIEARIWVNQAALAVTPVAFDWSGQFDGAVNGATYGYAAIRPKQAGNYYAGLPGTDNTWGGPFGIILRDESLVDNYANNQFVEFSVNLSKLGLDGSAVMNVPGCNMPFRRILVKTRASASFTSELKDFVGPFDFFLASKAIATTSTPLLCNGNVARLDVINPVSGSQYEWTTTNGTFTSSTVSSSVYVNQPGTYIVTQTLQTGCSPYAKDTVNITAMSGCIALAGTHLYGLTGALQDRKISLTWNVRNNAAVDHLEIEKSGDGERFEKLTAVQIKQSGEEDVAYDFLQANITESEGWFRVIAVTRDGAREISTPVFVKASTATGLTIRPNPARSDASLSFSLPAAAQARIMIVNSLGTTVYREDRRLQAGWNTIQLRQLERYAKGIYWVKIEADQHILTTPLLLRR